MTARSRRCSGMNLLAAVVLAGLMAASCAPQYSAPQQVQANNPNVTYKYHNDQELLEVNQTAAAFCNQYRAVPRPASFANAQDGSKVIVFECVPSSMPMAALPQFNPNLAYT
jgi:methionyl-tRNA formyltransferase